MKELPVLYIVIPCYNEQQVLPVTAPMFFAKLRGLISETQTAQDAYPAVLNIMAEDAAQFFAGQITAEQAAAYTQDRVSIWLAEQG